MLGLGETIEEVEAVMNDLSEHGVQILTLGQYLQPSLHHLPVERYVAPAEFEKLRVSGEKMGFTHVALGAYGALFLPRRPAGACRDRLI
tara:strand:+ start:860 stop:1126 length:267 start_codon:yes stop_codon:yes gene_type:complete